MGRQAVRYISGAIGIALVLGAWLLLAPRQVGGQVSYAIITGSSMEPKLQAGDLAIIRSQDRYEVGDVVAYESEQVGRVVLHRIVGESNGGFVMKGDNNDFLDTEKPATPNIIGELWIRVPSGGGLLQRIREPWTAAVVVALLSTFSLGVTRFKRRTSARRSGSREDAEGLAMNREHLRLPSGAARERTIAAFALATLCLAAVAMFAYIHPSVQNVTDKIPYEHQGTFSYSAKVPTGPVYPDGLLETGDPVFLQLVDKVTVNFIYEFASEAPHSVSGDGRLVAELSDTNGWTHSVVLDADASLQGDRLNLAGTLHLKQMRALVEDVERLTGVARESYTLTVTPEIRLEGTLSANELVDSFAPLATFQLDALQLSHVGAEGEKLRPAREAYVEAAEVHPATVDLFGVEVSISALRQLAPIGMVLALVALIVSLKWGAYRESDEIADIQARYGARLIRVARMPRSLTDAIEVADMATLAQLAEAYERVILHVELGGRHSYGMEYGGTLYVHNARAGVPPATSEKAHRPKDAKAVPVPPAFPPRGDMPGPPRPPGPGPNVRTPQSSQRP